MGQDIMAGLYYQISRGGQNSVYRPKTAYLSLQQRKVQRSKKEQTGVCEIILEDYKRSKNAIFLT